jgi:hypothetical protein
MPLKPSLGKKTRLHPGIFRPAGCGVGISPHWSMRDDCGGSPSLIGGLDGSARLPEYLRARSVHDDARRNFQAFAVGCPSRRRSLSLFNRTVGGHKKSGLGDNDRRRPSRPCRSSGRRRRTPCALVRSCFSFAGSGSDPAAPARSRRAPGADSAVRRGNRYAPCCNDRHSWSGIRSARCFSWRL